jgi:acetamidase/formamidase
MITPTIKGGHEVNIPVAVEGADVGDAIAIKIEKIKVLSKASSSGVDEPKEGAYEGDPFVNKKCPECGMFYPAYEFKGTGQNAVKCKNCGASVSPFRMVNGYTMALDNENKVGITVNHDKANEIAKNAWAWHNLPEESDQVPILLFGKADIVGAASRLKPFLGQIGTTPAVDVPDSHNAGNFGSFLIDAPHKYSVTKEDYDTKLTDGHLDIDVAGEGTIIIAPVKVKGAGVYAGDAHAMQGDGEAAGHTTDVSSETTVQVQVIKKLGNKGPIILPLKEHLPPLAKPWSSDEWEKIELLARKMSTKPEPTAPIQVVGSGVNINEAAANGFQRASDLLEMTIPEVKNRVTFSGAVEIGRLPGIVQVTLHAPLKKLEKLGISELINEQYGK